MKLIKKLALLCLALAATVGFGAFSACKDEGQSSSTIDSSSQEESSSSQEDSSSSEEDEPEVVNFVYRIKVQNGSGFGISGVRVTLYDGETVVAEKVTSGTGYATFGKSDILLLGEYKISVSDIPKGYELDEPDRAYQTLAVQGFESFIQLNPTGVMTENEPLGLGYKLGNVMYDFSVKTSDGDTFTLSEELKTKELVLINFWATWCGPCKAEFPAMNAAYLEYQDKVSIIAVSTTDGMSAVSKFKGDNGIAFDMTSGTECGENILSYFNTAAVPVTVMVDRYGAIVYYHVGNMTAKKDFTSRFDKFLGDDYVPTVIIGSGDEEDGPSGEGGSNLVKPDIPAPELADVKTALGDGADSFTFEWDLEDEYAWPWLVGASDSAVGDKMDFITVPATLSGIHGGYATLKATVNAKPGNAILFDYYVNTAEGEDILFVLVDGVPVQQLSGINKSGTCGAYVFREYETEGEHEIIFLYLKDDSGSIEGETVRISNLRLEQTAENVNGLVFRHAANVLDESENAATLYKNYATVVLNEEDGYYHVGEKNGPLLFANLMLSSRWSETSVWLLAYADYIVYEGYNFHSDIEDFAWGANQPIPGKSMTFGYTPVTQALKELLQYTVASEAVAENGYKYFKGETHENEWLETCVYWEAYGSAEQLEDPMKTITFHAAQEVFTGTQEERVKNEASVLFAMTPRGFKYKFTPETSGVYHIYSEGAQDTVCFFVASDQTTFLGIYEDVIGATRTDESGKVVADMNFSFHYYLTAGETYYLLLTTYLDAVCTYDFYIDYVGETYSYMENLSIGPYSFNEVSGELYLPDAKDYGYCEEDGYYHILNEDGSFGEIIYVDMVRATVFFPYDSLEQIAEKAASYDKENRAFYVNGVDYTDVISDYAFLAAISDHVGFVALDKTLFEALTAITTSVKYDGISDSWQMLCYYYRTLSANE